MIDCAMTIFDLTMQSASPDVVRRPSHRSTLAALFTSSFDTADRLRDFLWGS